MKSSISRSVDWLVTTREKPGEVLDGKTVPRRRGEWLHIGIDVGAVTGTPESIDIWRNPSVVGSDIRLTARSVSEGSTAKPGRLGCWKVRAILSKILTTHLPNQRPSGLAI